MSERKINIIAYDYNKGRHTLTKTFGIKPEIIDRFLEEALHQARLNKYNIAEGVLQALEHNPDSGAILLTLATMKVSGLMVEVKKE